MTILYNCKQIEFAWRITKFDNDMNVESSYLTTAESCECPQGAKPTCRHRKMLPAFLEHKHVGDGWFYNYDTRQWHNLTKAEGPTPSGNPSTDTLDELDIRDMKGGAEKEQLAGEGPEQSTHAAEFRTSPSASPRGEPAPVRRRI